MLPHLSRSRFASSSAALSHLYRAETLMDFFSPLEGAPESCGNHRLHNNLCLAYETFLARLDKNYVISPGSFAWAREIVNAASVERKAILERCGSNVTPAEKAFLDRISERSRSVRRAEHVSRICWALNECDRTGWFPVFVTLTVRDDQLQTVFATSSPAFKNYIRRVRLSIGRALGMTKRKAEEACIHEYFAVVERGETTGRLHIHCLHLCRALPERSRDPNAGRAIADLREISSWRDLWPYGFVSAVPVRLNSTDVYAHCGWRWPVVWSDERAAFEPYVAKGCEAVAHYMGKYILKSYSLEKEDFWRCRMNRNFGLRRLIGTLSQIRTIRLVKMLEVPIFPTIVMENRTISESLMRRMMIRTLIRRHPSLLGRLSRRQKAPSVLERLRTNILMWTAGSRSMGGFECLRSLESVVVVRPHRGRQRH